MKYSLKKICNFKNILWILIILLIIIIGYNLFVYLNVYEGAINMNVAQLVIQPAPGTADEWLNIAEITLYDANNNVVTYTAKATIGRSTNLGTYANNNWYYDINKINDGSDYMFHSAAPASTLTMTPSKNGVVRIKIKNRQDCCQFRLDRYQLVLRNSDNVDIGDPIELKKFPNLFDASKNYTEDMYLPIPIKGETGSTGSTGATGATGATGKPGVTVPVDNSYSGSVQTTVTIPAAT